MSSSCFAKFNLYSLYSLFGLLANGYYLYHMYMLNIWLGDGITPLAIWRQHLYLTNINHVLLVAYYLWLVMCPKFNFQTREKFRQFLMSLSLFVSILYWAIRLIDMRLVHGRHTPEELGSNYVIFIHGLNHIILLFELFLIEQQTTMQDPFKQNYYYFFITAYSILLAFNQFGFGKVVYGFQKPLGVLAFLAFIPTMFILELIDALYSQKLLAFFTTKLITEVDEKLHRKQRRLKNKQDKKKRNNN